MKTFLEHVAQHIISTYGTDLSHIAVVFPNKRASLFLSDALARLADHPLWSPAYITISQLFRQQSPLQVADPIKLICDLHQCYTSTTGFDETLDHFYGWGQLLLADFDDIDKNLAPAEKVFANLRDLHEFDDISYLSDEQRQLIRKFFSNFSDDHDSLLKERFLRLWSHIGDIYHAFNQRLADQQLAYEGALYRSVIQTSNLHFAYDHYLFVGFNMLQQVEQRLFTILRQQGKAHFYWDFDHYYLQSEAGHFIAQYLRTFPNELDADRTDIYSTFTRQKRIAFIAATTENIQSRYVSEWLRQDPARIADGRRTAIVLANEALLPMVIHSLPDEADKVNITTGYPLQLSPVTSLIGQLITLQTTGYDKKRQRYRLRQVSQLLAHPYISYVSTTYADVLQRINSLRIYYPDLDTLATDDALRLLFARHCETNADLLHWMTDVIQLVATRQPNDTPLTAEALFRAYTLLNRLTALVDTNQLRVDIVTLQRLVTQLIQSTTIPFHGEPAVGLQVMGVLETRNLDFDHVLVLSCNEGNMPRGVNDSSFIPYSIRKAFGLTTVDHKVAIYAYYFHRLLSRASDITLLYNCATNDGQTGEMSRFMLQMLVESPHRIVQQTLQAEQTVSTMQRHAIPKSPEVVNKLRQRYDISLQSDSTRPILSPTAINRYMRCPLQFYYNYVEDLREPDDNDDDTIDNRIFGNIFHKAAQLVYQQLMQRNPRIMAGDLEQLLKSKVEIEMAVDAAFREELFQQKTVNNSFRMELDGLQIINREVIIHYLRQLIKLDTRLAPFTILQLEQPVVQRIPIAPLGITTTIGGLIDRLDMVNDGQQERIRVIDYKTGSHRLRPMKDIDAIFDPTQIANHSDYYLQTMLYSRIVRSLHPQTPVAPALLFIQHAAADDYNPILKLGSDYINDVATPEGNHFVKLLMNKVNEIFNPDLPFHPTAEQERCRTCPYAQFCGQ